MYNRNDPNEQESGWECRSLSSLSDQPDPPGEPLEVRIRSAGRSQPDPNLGDLLSFRSLLKKGMPSCAAFEQHAILNKGHFCNTNRMWDRGTQELLTACAAFDPGSVQQVELILLHSLLGALA